MAYKFLVFYYFFFIRIRKFSVYDFYSYVLFFKLILSIICFIFFYVRVGLVDVD